MLRVDGMASWEFTEINLEIQWPVIMGYFGSFMGYFGA